MKHMARRENPDLHRMVIQAVDEGLAFLTESGRRAMYYQAEKRFKIKREDIPHQLEGFQTALEGLFGYGGNVIEVLIARRLYTLMGLNFEPNRDWHLKDYVNNVSAKINNEIT